MTERDALQWASDLCAEQGRKFRAMTVSDLRALVSKLNRALKMAEKARSVAK